MREWQTGQDVIKYPTGSAIGGFNRRIAGIEYADAFQYPHERQDRELLGGWNLADKMISEGRLFYRHNFHNSHDDCRGFAFSYGGTWVCNTCGRNHLDKEWWKIKVYQDGSAWCCVGLGFENLQESENYAFGDTREEAIKNYGDVMVQIESSTAQQEQP